MSDDLRNRVDELEVENADLRDRVAALEEVVEGLQSNGTSAQSAQSSALASHYGFSDYVEPAVRALAEANTPGETVTLSEVKAYLKRETQCSNPKTVKKYAKEITKFGPFSPGSGVGTWTFDGIDSEASDA